MIPAAFFTKVMLYRILGSADRRTHQTIRSLSTSAALR
jgi:hypothetical protein